MVAKKENWELEIVAIQANFVRMEIAPYERWGVFHLMDVTNGKVQNLTHY